MERPVTVTGQSFLAVITPAIMERPVTVTEQPFLSSNVVAVTALVNEL